MPEQLKTKRVDAQRNQQAVLSAAASAFVESGVEAPIREIARKAGVGTATIYRNYPTRADLIMAVYHHQVDTCAEAGPVLLESSSSPYAALRTWIDLFVDFLTTKHGLARVLQSDDPCFDPLHEYFLGRLVPVCAQLLEASVETGQVIARLDARELMRAVGSLCIGSETDPRKLVALLINGLRP